MENKMIIDSLRDYFLLCELLKDGKLNIDFLGDGEEYSIDPLPADPIVKKYVDGGTVRQLEFAFTSKSRFDDDARTGIENSGFCQKLIEWVENNNKNGVLPVLEDPKHVPVTIEITASGYLFDMDSDYARYQIQCRLVYEQEV